MACAAERPRAPSKNRSCESAALETALCQLQEGKPALHTRKNLVWQRGTGSRSSLKQPGWSGAGKGQSSKVCRFQMDGLGLQGKQCPLSTLPSSSHAGEPRIGDDLWLSHVMPQTVCWCCWISDKLLKVWVWLTAKSVTQLLFPWLCFPLWFPLLFLFHTE